MKKDTSHEEQLRNYLEGASNVGNKGAEQPESELPDIAAIAPSVVLANLFLEATSQANGDVTCDVCDNLATVELPFKEFDLDGATMESPWLACERCRDLIARRSTKQLIEIVVGQVRPSTEFRPFIERTWKYISKKLFTSVRCTSSVTRQQRARGACRQQRFETPTSCRGRWSARTSRRSQESLG